MRARSHLALVAALALSAVSVSTEVAAAPARTPRGTASRAAGGGALIVRPFRAGAKARLPTAWRIGKHSYVSQAEYRDLRDGTMELLRRFPPDKHFFVGLGRDAAPVIAFLQNLGGKDLAVNLPGASGNRWAGQVSDDVVARHVDAAIPEKVLIGKRKIVLVDVTVSAKTMASFGGYMDDYLERRGIGRKAAKVAMTPTRLTTGRNRYGVTTQIITKAWPDFWNYNTGKYEGDWHPDRGGDGIAEHQRHDMHFDNEQQPPTATNPAYTAFRKAVMARMEQDAELDGFLATLTTAASR